MARKTKKMVWAEIVADETIQQNKELVEFINTEIERLNKRANGKKAQEANAVNDFLAKSILEGMTADKRYRVLDLISSIDALTGLTTQKITPICKNLVSEGKLSMIEEKRIKYYTLVVGGDVA